MNYGKRIALFRPPSTRSIESESVLSVDDYDDCDEKDNVKRRILSGGANETGKVSRKTRNLSEKKRRDQFNLLINELCSMVAANNKKMDKSTVLRSAIQFLKTHQEISVQSAANEIREDWKPSFLCNEEFTQLMLEAVDSFMVVFSQQGSILYVSESVASLLGHLPSDLINRSLYDFVHEDDHVKLYNMLSTYHMQTSSVGLDFEKPENQLDLTCHFRRGTIDPKDQSTYEFVRISGSSRILSNEDDILLEDLSNDPIGMQSPKMSVCFCCTVQLQTSHIIREMPTVNEAACEFTSRHSLEWKFLFLDHRAPPIIGYLPFEVLGTSGYDYYHPEDIERVSKCHEQLMQMGEGTSCYYRFLTKGQQWIWMRTRYYITYHQWNSKPEFIVCTNTVVRYEDVRSQLRKEMGYTEYGYGMLGLLQEPCKTDKSRRSPSMCSVSSGGQLSTRPVSPCTSRRSLSKSPDHVSSVSGQASDVDSSQHPHSTEKEPGQTRKYVTSQLQSLLQQHLQRNTALRSMQQQQQQQRAAPVAVNPTTSIATTSSPSAVPQLMPSIVPIMAMPPNMIPMPQAPQLAGQVMSPTNSIPSSPVVSSGQAMTSMAAAAAQSSMFLTPAQRLLHDQLLQKSEQLQDTIRRQQEELRNITQQLAHSQGVQQTQSPQQQQQQEVQQQQQQQPMSTFLAMQSEVPSSSQSVLLAQNNPESGALNVMCSGNSQIMLSQVHMDAAIRSATGQNSSFPFQIISPDSDLGFCNNDLSDSC